MIPQSFDEGVVREIEGMGHEIGYHYEDMDFAKGDVDKAYELAKKHLTQLREVAEIKTICMHGSPRSPFDNKEVWRKYDYRELGIIAEPYFDVDFSKVLYLTDTGRRWDGDKVSIRDKVNGRVGEGVMERGSEWESGRVGEGFERVTDSNELTVKPLLKEYSFRSTQEIINAAKSDNLPNQMMFNFHPQRWTDSHVNWTKELIMQNAKNVVKRAMLYYRNRNDVK